MSKSDYDFKHKPLDRGVCAELIAELYSGQIVSHTNIFPELNSEHLARGGRPPVASNLKELVRGALRKLQSEGRARSIHNGEWTVGETTNQEHQRVVRKSRSQKIGLEDTTIIGEGESCVYVYHLPLYMDYSIERGETTWACKVGRTSGDLETRLLEQVEGTGLPEYPSVTLVLKTDNSERWEKAIHESLRVRNKGIDTIGDEWFDTSPDEVLDLIFFLDPSKKTKA